MLWVFPCGFSVKGRIVVELRVPPGASALRVSNFNFELMLLGLCSDGGPGVHLGTRQRACLLCPDLTPSLSCSGSPLSAPSCPGGRGEGTRRWKAGAAPSGPQGSVLYVGPRKESGSWAVVEQSRCTGEPGVSTKCWQGEEQYRKGLCKNGIVSSSDSACKRCVLRICGRGTLARGHAPAGPALPCSSSLCLLFGAVFFSLPGEPKHWLLGFRPQVVDVLGRLAAPSPGRGTPWKVHGRVGGGLLDAGTCGGT